MKYFTALVLTSLFAGLLMGQTKSPVDLGIEDAELPEGLKTGTKAPDIIGYADDGSIVTLAGMLEDGPVALVFYRGNWCGRCSHFLSNYADSLRMIMEKGAQVVAVTPEGRSGIEIMKEKTGLDIIVISDRGNRIMNDYGVAFHVTDAYQEKIDGYYQVDIARLNGQTDAVLPVPASYWINRKQKITWRHFDLDYRKRPSAADLLANMPK